VDIVDYGTRPVSGLTAVSWSTHHASLFVQCDTGTAVTRSFDGSTYSDWRQLARSGSARPPAAATRSVAAASSGPGRIDLITSDATTLWHQCLRGSGRFVPRTGSPLEGPPTSTPVPLAHLMVGQPPSGHPPSEPAPTAPITAPALAAPYPDRLEVYVVDADGDLWFRDFDAGWHDWTPLGRPPNVTLMSDPAAAGQPGWRSALVRGDDNAIWQREWVADRWLPWTLSGPGRSLCLRRRRKPASGCLRRDPMERLDLAGRSTSRPVDPTSSGHLPPRHDGRLCDCL
jgi:hypothetical protein